MKKHLSWMLFVSVIIGLCLTILNMSTSREGGVDMIIIFVICVILYAFLIMLPPIIILIVLKIICLIRKKKRMANVKPTIWSIWSLSVIIILTGEWYGFKPDSSESNTTQVDQASLTAEQVYKKVNPSIFIVNAMDRKGDVNASGTAVAVRKHLLVTNCHVIQGADYFAIMKNNREEKGELYSAHGDICIFQVKNDEFVPVNIRHSRSVDIGDNVYAIGNPYNPVNPEKTISNGIISNKYDNNGVIILQTNAAISPGSSGGGLFDTQGNLVGITTLVYDDERAQNINFALPTETIEAAILEPRIDNDEHADAGGGIRGGGISQNEKVFMPIGSYGEDKVGLYQLNEFCFLTFVGRNENGNIESLVFWAPSLPRYFYVFPSTTSVDKAREILDEYFDIEVKNDNDYITTNNFIVINKSSYQLVSKPTKKSNYAVLQGYSDINPIKSFIDGEYFVVMYTSAKSTSGYTEDRYGLNGFSEALAAYHENCDN